MKNTLASATNSKNASKLCLDVGIGVWHPAPPRLRDRCLSRDFLMPHIDDARHRCLAMSGQRVMSDTDVCHRVMSGVSDITLNDICHRRAATLSFLLAFALFWPCSEWLLRGGVPGG